MLKYIIAVALVILSSTFALSDEAPVYEGVYVRTSDGNLHQLSPASRTRPLNFSRPEAPNTIAVLVNRQPFYIEDVWRSGGNIPVFSSADIKSIVVNSRNNQFNFLEFGVHSEGYFGPQMIARPEKNPHSPPRGTSQLISADWGYAPSSSIFRVRNINQFTTEYELTAQLSGAIRSRTYSDERTTLDVQVFAIKLSDGTYHFLLTDHQANSIIALNSDVRIFSTGFIQYLRDELND